MRGHVTTFICLIAALATVYGQLTKPAECGSTMGCYSQCEGGSCEFVVTWKSNGDNVDFSLSIDTATQPGDRYIALGLSGDDKMGDDSVTDCIRASNSVTVAKTYNEDGVKSNVPIDEIQSGLSNITGSSSRGVLRCSYSQTKAPSSDKVKALTRTLTLLVADGAAPGGFKNQHDELPSISPEEVDFEKFQDLSGVKKNVSVKLHGCLMVFAWMFCASIGIFLARFYKPVWPNSKVCSEKVWFTFHRTCMVLAVLFCAAGFIVIFVDVQEWSELDGHTNWQKAHPYLGCIVTFLALLNPIMAVFRPHPEDKMRPVFNWGHWLVGTGAHILAALTIILGLTLDKASVPFDCVWIVVGWLCYQMAVVLIMELSECIIDDKGYKYYKDGVLKEPKGSAFKKVVLACHVIIIAGLTVAVIVMIAIN